MVVCENLMKIYKTSEIEVVALQGLDLTVKKGELMAIIGNSGSGKSTLLNMLGGLDRPSAGTLLVDGRDLLKMTPREMMLYKRNSVGFVWQNHARNLVPYLTALDNVMMPMMLNGKQDKKRAQYLLELVGLGHRKKSVLSQLSGGEQQRVAIAISLANNPKMVLADEPTGAVDSQTSKQILGVFRDISENLGVTVIIVTHDRSIARSVDRTVAIRDGRTSSEILRRTTSEDLSNVEGLAEEEIVSHEEFAVLDRVGRLQLPKEYTDQLGITGKNKVRVSIDGDKILISRPDEEDLPEQAGDAVRPEDSIAHANTFASADQVAEELKKRGLFKRNNQK
ncbi:MAG: ABC transporter ATP-binding protein [Clostridia bacterium]|nr:ABC transporter ATP-binding protein [Clostridia bacterium]